MRTSRKGIELIKAHEATYDPDRMAEFQQELDILNVFREECKGIVQVAINELIGD